MANFQLLGIILIIILAVILYLVTGDSNKSILTLAVGTFGYVLFMVINGFNDSKNESLVDVTNKTTSGEHLNIDTDDTEFSPHGNMSLSWDADTLQQRKPVNLNIGGRGDKKSKQNQAIDNSDLVDDLVRKGDTHHQPLIELGVTTTENAYMNPYTMHGKSNQYRDPDGIPKYTIPLNDRGISFDEAMAIKQNHRSMINRKAIEGAVRTGAGHFERFYRDELDENEKRVWWSAEAEDLEVAFRAYE
jgi:hypothetical protein